MVYLYNGILSKNKEWTIDTWNSVVKSHIVSEKKQQKTIHAV